MFSERKIEILGLFFVSFLENEVITDQVLIFSMETTSIGSMITGLKSLMKSTMKS